MSPETADAGDLVAIMNVFDGADLAVSAAAVERAIAADRVLVARSAAGTVIGALLAEPADSALRIAAVAVRQGRRGQGIGTALVEAAAARWTPVRARFDPAVWPFYRSLGFERTGSPDESGRMTAVLVARD